VVTVCCLTSRRGVHKGVGVLISGPENPAISVLGAADGLAGRGGLGDRVGGAEGSRGRGGGGV
jgi:hypothetical protein